MGCGEDYILVCATGQDFFKIKCAVIFSTMNVEKMTAHLLRGVCRKDAGVSLIVVFETEMRYQIFAFQIAQSISQPRAARREPNRGTQNQFVAAIVFALPQNRSRRTFAGFAELPGDSAGRIPVARVRSVDTQVHNAVAVVVADLRNVTGESIQKCAGLIVVASQDIPIAG